METVTENKVLTQEELQTLKTIQDETQSLILELGEIELTKIQLEKRYESAKTFLAGLELKEQEFTQSIFQKHGKVSINPSTGEINSIS
jgi:chromosome segregation ATPase